MKPSMMRYIEPRSVDMSQAARDFHSGGGRLTRSNGGEGVFSATGIFGDGTLATVQRRKIVIEAILRQLFSALESLRSKPAPGRSRE
jgi:creatinine amidohydrolase/Fe(II)-dependent formamide hydrolase-like protein